MKMKKYVLSICLIATFLLLASGWSFAAPVLNGGNTTLAAEKIPVSGPGGYIVGTGLSPTGVNVAYSGGTLALGGQLKITLGGGTFSTATPDIDVCNTDSPGLPGVMGFTLTQSATQVVYQLTTALSPGTSYAVQPAGCAALSPQLKNIVIPAGSAVGAAVTMTFDNQTNPGDANVYAVGTIVTVKNQFAASVTPATSVLSFSTTPVLIGFTASGIQGTIPWTDALDSYAGLTITSDQSINDLVVVAAGGGSCQRVLTDADTFALTVTGNLAGIGFIGYSGNNGPAITAAQLTAGSVPLSVTGDFIQICYLNTNAQLGTTPDTPSMPATMTLVVPSTPPVSINAGTYNLAVTLQGGGGGSDVAVGYSRVLLAPTLDWTILNPSNTYYIENILVTNGNETYIKFQSNATQTGLNGVSVAILTADVTPNITYTATIVPGTPLMILGSQLAAAALAQGHPVSPSGFAAIVKVNAPSTSIFQYASVCNAEGCKTIPVEVLYTTSTTGNSGRGGYSLDSYGRGGGSSSFTVSPSSPILY